MVNKKQKKKKVPVQKETDLTLKRTGGWTQALVTLVFILIPAIVMWVFLSRDFDSTPPLNNGERWGVAIGFVGYSFLISVFLIWIQLIWIDTMNFTIPVAIVLMAILVSDEVVIWGRALIAIGLVMIALPINMMTVRYVEHLAHKQKKSEK